jgi:hypothetical protein
MGLAQRRLWDWGVQLFQRSDAGTSLSEVRLVCGSDVRLLVVLGFGVVVYLHMFISVV